jgi:sec-independent protein translocase protein TatA
MFGIGGQELIFVFLIVLLIFGGKKIPEIARGLGRGIREFKKAKEGVEESLEEEAGAKPGATPTPVTPADDKKKIAAGDPGAKT